MSAQDERQRVSEDVAAAVTRHVSDHAIAGTKEEREALGFKRWPDSGVQTYRVQYQSASGGMSFVDVDAKTGDEAATKALAELGGGKVTNIAPAP